MIHWNLFIVGKRYGVRFFYLKNKVGRDSGIRVYF